MSYYEDLLKNIEYHINNKSYDKAKELIDDELKMAYVPSDVLLKLKEFEKVIPISNTNSSLTIEEIVDYLKGNAEKQLIGVEALNSLNLRNYLDICNDFLCSKANKNAKVLLIDSLIRQEVSDEIKYIDDDISYNFIPRFIMSPENSPGFLKANELLADWYMKDPSKYELAKSLVYKDAMLALPINYDENEGELLASKAYKIIEKAFN